MGYILFFANTKTISGLNIRSDIFFNYYAGRRLYQQLRRPFYLSFFQIRSLQVIKEKFFNWHHLLTSMFMCIHVVYIICLQFWPRTGSRNPFRSSRRQCEISIWGDQRYSFSHLSFHPLIHSSFYAFLFEIHIFILHLFQNFFFHYFIPPFCQNSFLLFIIDHPQELSVVFLSVSADQINKLSLGKTAD